MRKNAITFLTDSGVVEEGPFEIIRFTFKYELELY